MRNDVKPVTPKKSRPAGGGSLELKEDSAFDAERNSGRRRERGDDTDPVGPKPSASIHTGTTVTVTDPSGTTGPVSRSNSRTSTTTGKLRDRDLERSARTSSAPDIALATPRDTLSNALPWTIGLLAILIALLSLGIFAFSGGGDEPDTDSGIIRAGDRVFVDE
jgi:hypothetical protein